MGRSLKKTKVKLDLITIDIDMSLITEIGVRERKERPRREKFRRFFS